MAFTFTLRQCTQNHCKFHDLPESYSYIIMFTLHEVTGKRRDIHFNMTTTLMNVLCKPWCRVVSSFTKLYWIMHTFSLDIHSDNQGTSPRHNNRVCKTNNMSKVIILIMDATIGCHVVWDERVKSFLYATHYLCKCGHLEEYRMVCCC